VLDEPRDSLESTITAVIENLPYFANANITNEEIVVVVIYDGINYLNDGKNLYSNIKN